MTDAPDPKGMLTRLVADQPCPKCTRVGKLRIEMKLVAKPLGTFSLAGSNLKFSANEIPVLYCDGCGLELEGNLGR